MLAHDIFGENARDNGFVAGAPNLTKDMRTIRRSLRSPAIEILFASDGKIVALSGTETIPAIWVPRPSACGRDPGFRRPRLECGNIVEISAIQARQPG
jgi:hypothetical protein